MIKSIVIAALLLSVTAAMGQERARVGACAADIKEKCAGVERGEGRIRACVKEHLTEFSEPCQTRLAKVAAIGKACSADVKQKCAKERGRARKATCIKGVLGEVGDKCKEALGEAVAGRE